MYFLWQSLATKYESLYDITFDMITFLVCQYTLLLHHILSILYSLHYYTILIIYNIYYIIFELLFTRLPGPGISKKLYKIYKPVDRTLLFRYHEN